MPTYTYRARDKQGELLAGQMEADTEAAVAHNLRSIGYAVVAIEAKAGPAFSLGQYLRSLRKIPAHEIVFLSRQLASLLKAGIPLATALGSIAEQAPNPLLKETVGAVLKDIQGGTQFSAALAKYPAVFSELFVSMVKVGETAGILDQVLDRLAHLGSQELEVKARVRAAMTYPVILVTVALVIVTFLMVSIVPKFVAVFDSYGAELPVATRILLGISFVVRRLWPFLLVGLGTAVWGFRRYVRTEKGRYTVDRYLLKLPFFGELYIKVIVSRFARTLGALVKSGVSMLEALSVTNKTIDNAVVNHVIENIQGAITEGQPLTEPFRASGIFPPTVVQMIALGEQSGHLDEMLAEVATFYDQEVDYTIRNLTTALEPMLLLFMGGMVAFIALSVLMPIFNLIKVLRQ